MKKFKVLSLGLFIFVSMSFLAFSSEANSVNSDKSLQMLIDGNKRFTEEKYANEHLDSMYRKELTKGQHPFAVVVTCSDSRVAPELLFDQGLGDIFVIRTAGEVVDKLELGSIEYAVEHLGTKLVVVLGHEFCGAVTAAIAGGKTSENIAAIIEEIKPAVEKAKKEKGDLLTNAIHDNVDLIVEKINEKSEIIKETKNVKVVGAVYSISTNKVEFFK